MPDRLPAVLRPMHPSDRRSAARLATWTLRGAAAAVVLLAACGDGGGGAELESGPALAGSTLFERVKLEAPEWHLENLRAREAAGDDWRGEALYDLAKPAFGAFLASVLHGSDVGELVGPDFRSTRLRPAELRTVFDDGNLIVRRGTIEAERFGPERLRKLVAELVAPFTGEAHQFFKMVHVEDGSRTDLLQTVLFLHLSGPGQRGPVQQNLELGVDFAIEGDGSARVVLVTVHAFEETEASGPLFSDMSGHVFAGVSRFKEDFLRGIPEYRFRNDIMNGRHFTGIQGLALGDVNGDGLDDVYVCQQGGLANRLLLMQADGTFRDASAAAGVDVRDSTRSALIADFDGDGDQDLAFATTIAIVVAYNDGQGKFTDSATLALDTTADVYSMCAADPDQDGDLDLYACRWSFNNSRFSTDDPPAPYHDANNGAPNYYWRQDSPKHWVDATDAVGLGANNARFSYAAIWDDLDDDGDLDLYVANDFGRNNLYVNQGGSFTDRADELRAQDKSSGMGVTVGDYDLDGDKDIYVSNMFSSAGQRIVPQYAKRDQDGLIGDHFQFAQGNTLLRNRGDGSYEDVSLAAGVTVGGWAWGARFYDFNADGFPDLYSPNGYITNDDPGDL